MSEKDYYRTEYPYGKWITEDGDKVLFNRNYQPIWKREPEGKTVAASRNWWVPNIASQEFYYNESNPPYGSRRLKKTHDSIKRCLSALAEFGV